MSAMRKSAKQDSSTTRRHAVMNLAICGIEVRVAQETVWLTQKS